MRYKIFSAYVFVHNLNDLEPSKTPRSFKGKDFLEIFLYNNSRAVLSKLTSIESSAMVRIFTVQVHHFKARMCIFHKLSNLYQTS